MLAGKGKRPLGLLASALALVCLLGGAMPRAGHCLQAGSSAFQSSRPSSVLFEPTMSFIRQNMKLVESYVALLRSIFVGAYERPLITSTDPPPSRGPSPKVPPMDLPERALGGRRHATR